jgi:hypothetical protein
MPWKCPACQTHIRHDGERLEPNRLYLFNICRLELVADEETGKLTIAPLPPEAPINRRVKQRRESS